MAIILEEALKNEAFVHFFGVTGYTVPATNSSSARKLSPTNYMMDESSKYYDARLTGGKPAAATSADRSMICTAQVNGCQYLCVVISAKAKMSGSSVTRYTNFDEAGDLLDMGNDFAIQQVLGTEQPFGLYPVSGGENHVVVGPDGEVFALLPVQFDASQLQFRDTREEQQLVAPLAAGTAVGSLQIFYGSILIGQVNLQARHDVALAGTTISTDAAQNTGSSLFGGILKWCGFLLLGLLAAAAAALLIIRCVNVRRYQKQRRAKRQERREV